MKKVLCIKEGEWRGTITKTVIEGPKYGDECIITGEGIGSIGEPVFYLLEWPRKHGWGKHRFIPLSEIDEKEMVRKHKVKEVPAEMMKAINECSKRQFSKTPTRLPNH